MTRPFYEFSFNQYYQLFPSDVSRMDRLVSLCLTGGPRTWTTENIVLQHWLNHNAERVIPLSSDVTTTTSNAYAHWREPWRDTIWIVETFRKAELDLKKKSRKNTMFVGSSSGNFRRRLALQVVDSKVMARDRWAAFDD